MGHDFVPRTCSGPCTKLCQGWPKSHRPVVSHSACWRHFSYFIGHVLLHLRNQNIPSPFPNLTGKKMCYFQVQESAVSEPGRLFFFSKSTPAVGSSVPFVSSRIASELVLSYPVWRQIEIKRIFFMWLLNTCLLGINPFQRLNPVFLFYCMQTFEN